MHGVDNPSISWAASTLHWFIYRYFLQFHAKKSYKPGFMAVDDLSMSPECFGFGKLRIIVICGDGTEYVMLHNPS
jgi:hypothetical protein